LATFDDNVKITFAGEWRSRRHNGCLFLLLFSTGRQYGAACQN
jgi:hypothetical protein